MNHRTRMRGALLHQEIDRIPTQINYTGGMGRAMADHFGITVDEVPGFLDNHMVRIDLSHAPRLSDDGRITYDWWGVGFDPEEEGYFTSHNPLHDSTDLDAHVWPDPYAPGLLDDAAAIIAADGGEHFITPNFGWALFERAWSLRGLDTFMMDMALDPTFSEDLLERITEIQLVLIHRFIELGVDGGYFGDDYGAQKNMLFSPQMWRQLIKPRLARLFEPFREKDLPILLHSDGQIQEILPDLAEIGLTTLNPVQPEVLDHGWLQKNFAGRLTFYGGISTQTVLPYGTPDEVKRAIGDCAHTLAPKGTGLLLAPSHRMMTDIPMANVEAMLEIFRGL